MKQGKIDRLVIEPVKFPPQYGGGNGFQVHAVFDFNEGDGEQELLEVGTAFRADIGCDNLAQLFHDLAREIKSLPKSAPVNNKATLRVIR